jgi:hypothetical protein
VTPFPAFQVETFEHLAATPGTVLLRVAGRWRAGARGPLSPPVLVIDDGRGTHRLPALPGPHEAAPAVGPNPPAWRAAFTAPKALLDGQVAFAIDAGSGVLSDLPQPVPMRRRTASPPAVRPADDAGVAIALARERAGRVAAERTATEAHDALRRERMARAAAQRAAEETRAAGEAAAREAHDLRAQLEEAHAGREASIRQAHDLQAQLDEAHAAHEATTRQALDLQTRLDEANAAGEASVREAHELRVQLDEAHAAHEASAREAHDLQEQIDEVRAVAEARDERAERRIAELEAQRAEEADNAGRLTEGLRTHVDELESRLAAADSPSQEAAGLAARLAAATADREAAERQAAELETRVGDLLARLAEAQVHGETGEDGASAGLAHPPPPGGLTEMAPDGPEAVADTGAEVGVADPAGADQTWTFDDAWLDREQSHSRPHEHLAERQPNPLAGWGELADQELDWGYDEPKPLAVVAQTLARNNMTPVAPHRRGPRVAGVALILVGGGLAIVLLMQVAGTLTH